MSRPLTPPIHAERMTLRWGEMDAMHHLNNVAYFRYFEQARISWIEALGVNVQGDLESFVLATTTCRFLVPAVYPCDVVVELWAQRVGNSSFTLSQVMRRDGGDETVYADGEAVLVWIDTATGKSKPLPDHIRRALQPAG